MRHLQHVEIRRSFNQRRWSKFGRYGRFSDTECLLTKLIFSHGAFSTYCVICMFLLPWTRRTTQNVTSEEGRKLWYIILQVIFFRFVCMYGFARTFVQRLCHNLCPCFSDVDHCHTWTERKSPKDFFIAFNNNVFHDQTVNSLFFPNYHLQKEKRHKFSLTITIQSLLTLPNEGFSVTMV